MSACMLLPGSAAALSCSVAEIRSASAFVTPVTLDVLYMKLERGPVPFMKLALLALLTLAVPAAAAGVAVVVGVPATGAAVVLLLPPPPPLSLQLPGSLWLLLLLECCAD